MTDAFWRRIFLSAAAINALVGASLMFNIADFAVGLGLTMPRFDAFFSPLLGWMTLLFATLYVVVAHDLAHGRPIVWVTAAGKLGAVAWVWYARWRGWVSDGLAALALIDLAYAGLFLWFLQRRQPL